MRQIWHIFKKDARRLRWEVAATLVLLAWLGHLDRWRADWTPGAAEGWLNVLLPVAWAYLVGLLILQDPVVGDREFWLTLPCRRRRMVGAKALFVLCFIHLPYLLEQAAILAGRGFSPVTYFPHLLWKQLLLLLALTLPAAAVAALVENVVQFLLAAVLVAAGVVYAAGTLEPVPAAPWIQADVARPGFALLVSALGAGAILFMQYARRRTTTSRGIGAAAAIAAVVVFVWLPRETSAEVQCALDPVRQAAPLGVELSEREAALPSALRQRSFGPNVRLALPIRVSGLPRDAIMRLAQLSLDIRTASGERYEGASPSVFIGPRDRIQVQASIWPVDQATSYQVLTVTSAVYARIKDGPVSIKGEMVLELHRRGAMARIPVEKQADVPGLGKCASTVTGGSVYQLGGLNVVCESPGEIPYPTYVTLMRPGNGPQWSEGLGNAARVLNYPRDTWLSPLNRRNTFFPLVPREEWTEGTNQVPQDALPGAVLEVVPKPVTGRAIIKYEWSGVVLSKFALPPAN